MEIDPVHPPPGKPIVSQPKKIVALRKSQKKNNVGGTQYRLQISVKNSGCNSQTKYSGYIFPSCEDAARFSDLFIWCCGGGVRLHGEPTLPNNWKNFWKTTAPSAEHDEWNPILQWLENHKQTIFPSGMIVAENNLDSWMK